MSNIIKSQPGIWMATVKQNNDPTKQGRLVLYMEYFTKGDEKTDWVKPLYPTGITTAVPEVGQPVWVMFHKGDPAAPYWFGEIGKHRGKSKKLYLKPLLDSVSISTVTAYVKTVKQADGTTEIDLMSTMVAMANALKDHETRLTTAEGKITTLQGKVSTLETQMAGKAATGHTHA